MAPLYSLEGRVYWSETDAAQIAHFTSILRYCERAEEEFMLSLFRGRWRRGELIFPRVHVECDYYTPLAPHERWRVDIVSIRLGAKSIEYNFEVYNLDRGELAARGKIVAVAFDPRRGLAVEIPGEARKILLEAGAVEKGQKSGDSGKGG